MNGFKVRLWDKKTECMIYTSDIPFEVDCNMQEFLEIILGGYSDRYIPMLYIDKKDKNEIEIYEGDIVKDHTNGAIIEVTLDPRLLSILTTFDNVHEIIGHIYKK